MINKTIFERSKKDRTGVSVSKDLRIKRINIDTIFDKKYIRKTELNLPEVPEFETVRHYTNLSQLNYHIDKGIYPLGSCTMKYNPKINEKTASLDNFKNINPHTDNDLCQGSLEIMHELQNLLKEISGMDNISLQPAAGAHGELTSLMIIKAYFENKNDDRKYILVPDSAHGTNPASVTNAGFLPININSNNQGTIDIDDLKNKINDKVAGIMITNPNTLGIFEKDIKEISDMIHKNGSLLYMDGANLNAIMGIIKPGDMGVDIMHFNLHKTFSTPHGGGGPGAGPIGVKKFLDPFLPVPVIRKDNNKYIKDYNRSLSIGKIHSFYGNFAVFVKAYTYILMLGKEGLKETSENALINAHYLYQNLKYIIPPKYSTKIMHEFVLSGSVFKDKDIKTLDIAKRLLDYNLYAPTVYFPLIVPEALMIEPTETETKEELDRFILAVKEIVKEINKDPQILKDAPHTTPVKRIDEVKAAKDLNIKFQF